MNRGIMPRQKDAASRVETSESGKNKHSLIIIAAKEAVVNYEH